MAISREELHIGGRVFYKTRLTAVGGAAASMKLKPAIVRDIVRKAAALEFDHNGTKKRMLVPFSQIEPDEGWLDERERKEQAKKDRIKRELHAVDALLQETPVATTTLTYTLADKLQATDASEAANEKPVDEKTRADALAQIHALSQPKPPGNPWEVLGEPIGDSLKEIENVGRQAATVWPKEDQHEDELAHAAPRRREQAELFDFPGMRPEAEYEDEPEHTPKPPTRPPLTIPPKPAEPAPEPVQPPPPPPPPVQPVPVPEPEPPLVPAVRAPQSPVEALLQKIRAEFEVLIAHESVLETKVADAEKALAELRERLETNRERQKVLSSQERQVMRMLGQKPAEAPAHAAPAARTTQEAVPEKKRLGRPPGVKNKPKPQAQLDLGPRRGWQIETPAWMRKREGAST